jgi:D-xylose transport system permease protein
MQPEAPTRDRASAEFAEVSRDQASATVQLRAQIATALAGRFRLVPIVIALGVVWAFFAIQSPIFLSSRNLTNLTNQISVSTFLALALVFLVLVQQIDISLAAVAAVAGGIAAILNTESHLNVILAVAIALAFGAAAGLVQGAIVTLLDVPAFIVTLGGMFIFEAVLFWELPVTQVVPLANTPLQQIAFTYVPAWLSYLLGGLAVATFGFLRWSTYRDRQRDGLPVNLLRSTILPTAALGALVAGALVFVFNAYAGVPTPAIVLVGFVTALAYLSGNTPLGKHIYAIGGNPEAARRAGIRVKLVTVFIFALAGFLAAAGGIVQASQLLGVSEAASDLSLLLGALAAVVIGGISLAGGRGTVWGAVIGGIMVGSIQNGLDLINSSTAVQWFVEGAVLVIAITIDSLISKSSARGMTRR